MIYHAAPRGNAVLPGGVQRRYMMLDRLDWVPVTGTDGTWPVVGNGTPSTARPAVPEVTLPVRLTARGDVTVGGAGVAGGAGIGGDDDEVLGLTVQIDSTGTDYSGQLTAAITGPGKHRRTLPFVTGEGPDVPAVPVSVLSGDSVERALTLRTGAPLAPGTSSWCRSGRPVGLGPVVRSRRRSSRCSGSRWPTTARSRSAPARWARRHSVQRHSVQRHWGRYRSDRYRSAADGPTR